MNILFHLGHPAHFHLFKNVIFNLRSRGDKVLVVIKKKDVLEELLKATDIEYLNILPDGRKDGKLHVAIGQLKQDLKLWQVCLKFKPDLLAGTSVAISHVGKFLGIPSINVNEDDAEIVPLYAKLAYPWATRIIAPEVCSVGKWENKKVPYKGYHELAYLHPNHFTPSEEIASKYLNTKEKYFILRFAKLTAHHDDGIKGITNTIALKIIDILSKHGKVFITSERELGQELEPYRLAVKPIDMHHVMAFTELYIGDSQTMAAEAGVLGIPFIRFNDFVGKISYLKQLEEKYKLGYGIRPADEAAMYEKVSEILSLPNLKATFQQRRTEMLNDCIDLAEFLTDYIINYSLPNKK
ncbi:DUF354 domain-containing protein [Taibaiella lutea]|uniref:DUF354 domain-containing protein n=1 Tax=Taibaiella lutea TaxID=2608001 RepID=A0A5M6CMG8_9BACT|nr:DUF354 domain-containing protein [Taibaiella lutea]KAA5536243.1 DUF354 domain-containing protein [Taibaiella lutea]